MGLKRLFFALPLFIATAVGAQAAPDPWGEWLHVPAGSATEIPISRLFANDAIPPGAVTFRLADDYPHLEALPVGAPDRIVFDAEHVKYGTFAFTYEVESSSGLIGSTESVISVVPRVQPVAGDWSAILPLGTSNETLGGDGGGQESCEIGDGAEIGWYRSFESIFELCDFDGTRDLKDCRLWLTPFAQAHSKAVPDYRLAMIGDWDGDGVDEPGLYDPNFGALQKYEYGSTLGDFGYLVAAGVVVFQDPATSIPLAGSWQSASTLEFATWDQMDRALTDPSGQEIPFQPLAEPGQPLAANWVGGNLDSIGLWQDGPGQAHFLTTGGGSGYLAASGTPSFGHAFIGRWSNCGVGDYFLGLYPGGGLMQLVPGVLDAWSRGIHVKVTVDPDGGGGD